MIFYELLKATLTNENCHPSFQIVFRDGEGKVFIPNKVIVDSQSSTIFVDCEED